MASKNPSKQRKRVTPVPLSALPENGNLTSPSRQPMIVSNNNNNNHNNDDDDGSSSSSDDEYHIQITKKFEAPKRAPVASPSSTLSRTTTLEQVRAAPMANAKTLSTRNNSSKTHVGQIKSIAGTSAVNSHGDHLLAGHREAISSAMANRPSILPEDSSNDKIDAEAEFSDDDDNNDDDEHDVPPTIEKLSKQCWKCAVRLKNTQFYAAHVHPLLRVPVCAVCVADVTYIDDDDKCLGCGEEEEFQFCCDNCPRSFCLICTAKAYGGGIPGLKQAQTLQNDDKPWHCPYCNPAPALKQLQQDFCPSDDEDDDENKNSRTAGERTCEEAVEEYLAIEHEKQRSLKEMDDPAFLEAKKAEIRDEIQKTKPLLSKKKLNLLVQEEMEELKERYEKHDIRLSDRAASLLEELETVHNIDLAKLHKKYFGDEQKPGEGEEEAQDDERAEWKLAADAEVAKRIEEDHRKPAKNALSEEMYLKDTPEEVEELGTQSADEKGCSGEGFRKVWGKPTKAAIESAIAEEDQLFARSNIAIQKRFTETADLKENRDEEYRTSGVGSGGSMRIRRDSYVELNQARGKVDKSAKKAKKKTKKRIELPPPQLQKLPVQEVVATMQQTSFQSEPKMEPGSDSTIAKKTALAASDLLDLTNVAPQKKKKRTKSKPVIAGTEPNNQLIIGLDEDRVSHGSSDKSDEVLDDKFYRTDDEDYANSDLILSSREIFHSDRNVKKIEVRTSLAKHLKPHQREGVTFLYKNAFVDLNVRTKKVEDLNEAKNVGGAVLAHSMGLGKSLSTIATLDTAMNHPCLKDKAENAFIHSVLLIAPLNTISSWLAEFQKWTGKLSPSIAVFNVGIYKNETRKYICDDWKRRGGVLLVGKDLFVKLCKQCPVVQQADVVVLDESHTMLSNPKSQLYKALMEIKTKRRILLTGTPLQNNVMEYYHMITWARPEVLDPSSAAFEREFAIPIKKGMAKDSPVDEIRECDLKSTQLKKILEPYVNRKDSHVLRRDLPPMQQVVLHVRQSKMQTNLYKELRRHERKNEITSFFKRFHLATPIHAHPACLLMKSRDADAELEVDVVDSDGEGGTVTKKRQQWWQSFVDKQGIPKVKAVEQGPKIVLFLHILMGSITLGDKVVVFSQCLKTLDFIEEVLSLENWVDHVPSLASAFPGRHFGGWTRGLEYLRLDGATDSETRGQFIKKFQAKDEAPEDRVQLFLISCKAGGIGVTLHAANRVILIDSHFNPSIMMQALHRCYRYGQEKPVFVYRFLTEGTSEEKVYSTSVNKQGISLKLIDGKNIERSFSKDELSNLVVNDTWVQCDTCEKWRMLVGEDEDNLPDKWSCQLNKNDPYNNCCDAPERDRAWYYNRFNLALIDTAQSQGAEEEDTKEHSAGQESSRKTSKTSDEEDEEKKQTLVQNDKLLVDLVGSPDTVGMLSKYYFHETLLEAVDEADNNDESTSSDLDGGREVNETLGRKPAAKPTKMSKPPSVEASAEDKTSDGDIAKKSPNRKKATSKVTQPTPSKSGKANMSSATVRASPRLKQVERQGVSGTRKRVAEKGSEDVAQSPKRARHDKKDNSVSRNEKTPGKRKSGGLDYAGNKQHSLNEVLGTPKPNNGSKKSSKTSSSFKLHRKSPPLSTSHKKASASSSSKKKKHRDNRGSRKRPRSLGSISGGKNNKKLPPGAQVIDLIDSSSDED